MTDLDQLREKLLAFREARDWKQFHTLKNLSAALAIEAGELQELTLWKRDEEVTELLASRDFKDKLQGECADILNYLLLVADLGGFDLLEAANAKIELNEKRYPADKAKGNATKYDKL